MENKKRNSHSTPHTFHNSNERSMSMEMLGQSIHHEIFDTPGPTCNLMMLGWEQHASSMIAWNGYHAPWDAMALECSLSILTW